MNGHQPDELLEKGLAELGLSFSGGQIDAFMQYLLELKKWNKAYNLTGLKKDADIVIKHFLDSLLYLRALPEGPLSVVDVGSGAGFPGIPIKLMRPEIEMYLVEPTGKKAIFLRHITKLVRLSNIYIIEKRIEDTNSQQDTPVPADAAITRALFDVRDFIRKASHIVRVGGNLILSKGPKAEEELEELGDIPFEIVTCKLPLTDVKRHIIVLKKGKEFPAS
jgi:16S rRNA (guanine527-N7)-methyltransferase